MKSPQYTGEKNNLSYLKWIYQNFKNAKTEWSAAPCLFSFGISPAEQLCIIMDHE